MTRLNSTLKISILCSISLAFSSLARESSYDEGLVPLGPPPESLSAHIDSYRMSKDIKWHGQEGKQQFAFLLGHPYFDGPYVLRVKIPHGTIQMPHTHPEDRIYTIISGISYVGVGEKFDESKLVGFPAGSSYFLPAGTPHFHKALSGESIGQITAFESSGMNYLDKKNKGVKFPIPDELKDEDLK